ncbi:MAG: polyamine aminopropyltransferase [Fibrobacterales bacterium]
MGILHSKNMPSYIIYLTMFIMGGCGLAYEYTISKIASDLLGNSVKQWAIIIATMMFFMGIGSDLQKYIKDNNLFDKYLLAEMLLSICGAIAPIAMIVTYGQYPTHYVLVQYFFIASIGLLIGFEIPLLARINTNYIKELKFNIGSILKMDYLGSLCGAIVWVYLLPHYFTLVEMAFVLGLINAAATIVALIYFRKYLKYLGYLSILIALIVCGLFWGLLNAKEWSIDAEQYLYKDTIIFSETTQYQHIVMTDSRAHDISLYINGHLQFNSFDEHIYHENLVHPAMALSGSRKRVLILGGGDGLALREVLKYSDVEEVVLCDLDPKMTEIAQSIPELSSMNRGSLRNAKVTLLQNGTLIPSGKQTIVAANKLKGYTAESEPVASVQVINIDAANFLEQASGVFDVILIDFPDPNAPELAKLYSTLFYERLKKKLAITGVFVQQSSSPVFAKEAYLAIGRTMRHVGLSAFPYHDNVPTFGEWGWWIGGHPQTVTKAYRDTRFKQVPVIPQEVETRYINGAVIQKNFMFGKDQLKSQYNGVNTLTTPVVYDYYLEGWQRHY